MDMELKAGRHRSAFPFCEGDFAATKEVCQKTSLAESVTAELEEKGLGCAGLLRLQQSLEPAATFLQWRLVQGGKAHGVSRGDVRWSDGKPRPSRAH